MRKPFKMKSSPAKGIFGDLLKALKSKRTDTGSLGSQLKRGTERRRDKKYEDAGPNVRKQMVKEGYAKPIARTPGSFSTQQELEGNLVPNQELINTKIDKPKTKKTKFSGSGTDARKKQYDAKGWRYDDTIKGYNRDGTEIKKTVKKTVKKDAIEKSKLNLNPTLGPLDPKYLNNEELTLEDFKRITNPKKDFDFNKNSFDFNKTNDYSSSAVNKKSPSKKRGYKMNKNRR